MSRQANKPTSKQKDKDNNTATKQTQIHKYNLWKVVGSKLEARRENFSIAAAFCAGRGQREANKAEQTNKTNKTTIQHDKHKYTNKMFGGKMIQLFHFHLCRERPTKYNKQPNRQIHK